MVRPTRESLGEFLQEQRRGAELSLRQLADRAGVSNPYLSQIERGLRQPSADVLKQLAGALRISSEALYVRAGLLDEPSGDHSVEKAIRADGALGESQKKLLIDMYRALRSPTVTQPDPSRASGSSDMSGPDEASGPGEAEYVAIHEPHV